MSGGAMSAISAFWSRWTSRSRLDAIVSSGELSETAIRNSPVAKSAIRQRGGGSFRASHAYHAAAAIARPMNAGSKLKLVALTR
jgi:hypothetical protein